MVAEFRRHATFTFCKICPAGFRSISVFCGARGDSSVAGAGHRHPRYCPPVASSAINDITRIAPQRGNTQRQLRIPRHHGPMARRACGPTAQSIEAGFERCAQARCSGPMFRPDVQARCSGLMFRNGFPGRVWLWLAQLFLRRRSPGRDAISGDESRQGGQRRGVRNR